MARQERPVDPADGPLQAMAYELRKLRVEAGSPTYRSLARRTGYSPSTLSEAANGKRKPTLDVLLAYIGALGGDQQEWRRRWDTLDSLSEDVAADSPAAGLAPPDAVIAVAAPLDPPAAATGPGFSWRSSRTVTMAGLVLVVALAVFAGATKLIRHSEPAAAGPAAGPATPGGCPPTAKGAAFFARTYGSGTTIRQGPARVDHPLVSVPAGCTVGLTGFCVGEPIVDSTAYTPDVRWFMVAGGGVLSSATVHGNPPAGMTLSHCPGDRPLPTAITLHVAAGPRVTLTASGRDVDVVGYAAFYDNSWHQIGLTGPGRGTFAMDWAPAGAKPVTLAAAACLGGEAPTGVTDLRAYPTGGESRLAAAQRKAAGQVACLYPTFK
jgi:transcriptional regulator with XRE-family HTH domain